MSVVSGQFAVKDKSSLQQAAGSEQEKQISDVSVKYSGT